MSGHSLAVTWPEGYADPPFDGTIAGFRDTVIPARLKAIEQSLSEALADLLPDGHRLKWVTGTDQAI